MGRKPGLCNSAPSLRSNLRRGILCTVWTEGGWREGCDILLLSEGEWREEDRAHGDAFVLHEPERTHAQLYLLPLAPRCVALRRER